jgi:osmotically-inducible protein OsmY
VTARDVYLSQRLKEELAHDERVGELGIDVTVDGRSVHVSGSVTTSARRDAAAEVIREIEPNAEVHTDLTLSARDPSEAERLG